MNTNGPRTDSREVPEYHQNRCRFPLEELARYRGLYVAFSLDGSQILASGETMEEVETKLLAANIHPRDVVGSFIEPPGQEIPAPRIMPPGTERSQPRQQA